MSERSPLLQEEHEDDEDYDGPKPEIPGFEDDSVESGDRIVQVAVRTSVFNNICLRGIKRMESEAQMVDTTGCFVEVIVLKSSLTASQDLPQPCCQCHPLDWKAGRYRLDKFALRPRVAC